MLIRVLGPIEIVHPGRSVRLGPRLATLLLALRSEAGRLIPARRLIDLLWGGRPPRAAAATLRSHISHLRRALDPEGRTGRRTPLLGVGRGETAGYVLDIDPGHCDAARFEELSAEARELLTAGRPDECSERVAQALALIRGPVFGGLDHPFVMRDAARLTELIRRTRRLGGEALLAQGRAEEAVRELSSLLEEDPQSEAVRATLARALYVAGRTDEAATCCRQGIRLLRARGLDAPDLSRLQSAILRRELPLARGHGGSRSTPVPRQLPPDLPHFVGRDEQYDRAVDLLTRTGTAPATILISGLSGVGKTSLAVHVAHAVASSFPDGQLFAELGGDPSGRPSPADVLASFLRAFGTPASEIPSDPAERLQAYRTLLADKRVLVVLDDAVAAGQVRPLLPSGCGCAAIVTSRSVLSGLQVHRIPLGVLTPEQALELLTAIVGAERVRREPEHARSIVHRSGLLPLAVWVAGARLATRPSWRLARMDRALVDEHRRLDELAAGDVAVKAGLELSYRALDAAPRLALRRLGLLQGRGFSAWEVAALLRTPLGRAEQVVDALVETHLVEGQAGDRYLLHDLVRLFAAEKARTDPSDDDRDALLGLLGCAHELARRAARGLETEVAARRLDRTGWWMLDDATADRLTAEPLTWFARELPSLRRAVDLADRLGRSDLAVALAGDLSTYFRFTGRHDDWRQVARQVLELCHRTDDIAGRIAMRQSLGDLETIEDRYPEAIDHFERALADIRRFEDPAEVHDHHTAVLSGLGYIHRLQGDYERALAHLERARDLADDGYAGAFSRCGLASVHAERGDLAQAEVCFAEAVALARRHGYRGCECQALRGLGVVEHWRGNWERAQRWFGEAYRLSVEAGDLLGTTHAAAWQADIWVHLGQVDDAIARLDECLATYQATRNRWGEATVLGMLAYAEGERGDLDLARSHAKRALELWERLGSPYWRALHRDLLNRLERRNRSAPPGHLDL